MKKKHDPPSVRDRLPAMFVGDEPPPPGDALGVQSDLTTVLAFGLPGLALYLWNTLNNSDVAVRDRTSRKLMARLRRWLRGVLGIRVT